MRPTSLHQHFRTLRTFFSWCVTTGLLADHPMRGITMRVPKTLPRVPEDDVVRRMLSASDDTFAGRRNKALVALLADSGLRISEALRLRIEDVNFSARTIQVRGGKGGKDRVGFFGADTAQVLRGWLQPRRDACPEDFVFTDSHGRPLSRSHACHLLHRLSDRAGLPRKVGPHALRHYAATSILKQTGDLELVRQVLRHESLTMALRYAHIAKPEISRKLFGTEHHNGAVAVRRDPDPLRGLLDQKRLVQKRVAGWAGETASRDAYRCAADRSVGRIRSGAPPDFAPRVRAS